MEQIDFFNLLSDLTLEDVFQAYFECRRNKRRTLSSLNFEMNYEQNLIQLWKDITQRRYQIADSNAFIVKYPVPREVFAAQFRDRIVHHLVIGRLLPHFEKAFSDYSYSCRAGKGTLYGIRDIEEMLKICSKNYTKNCFVLRLDIEGFFFHIDKRILHKQIISLVNNSYFKSNKSTILYLIDLILNDKPTIHCQKKTPQNSWKNLPRTKSLFYADRDCGLPIGNLTSQIFANFYLNGLDHYITQLNPELFYGRYVDDMVLIHSDKEYLCHVKNLIQTYLHNNLNLNLHPKKIVLQHYGKGFLFIGAYILPNRTYPSKRLQKSFYRRISYLNNLWKNKNMNTVEKELVNKTLCILNSYFGLLRNFNSWRIKLKGWNMLSPEIREVFFSDLNFSKVKMCDKMKERFRVEARNILQPPLMGLQNKTAFLKRRFKKK